MLVRQPKKIREIKDVTDQSERGNMSMKESEFLSGLLPSHPDYEPIINAIRTKYDLREVYPQDEPIKEIYLGDEIVSMDEFTQDVKNQILENMENIFPENYVKIYKSTKLVIALDYEKELEKIDDEIRPLMQMYFQHAKNEFQTTYQLLDANIDETVKMICEHLLLGDIVEAPQDWFGKVVLQDTENGKVILAIASEITNLDYWFQEIRDLHKKTFKTKTVKITKTTVDTAYYLQLMRRNKDRDFVLDEFIRLNKFSLPRNKNTPRYAEVRNMYWERLKKRLKTAKIILESIGREEK